MKRKNMLKMIIILFIWTLLLVTIPFFVSKVEENRYKNNTNYISSKFDIKTYDIVMDVDKNNKVDVIETITIDIPGDNFNGMYKSIPLWLNYSSKGKIKTKKVEITNLRAEGEKFVINKNNDSINIRIGSDRTTTDSGLHTYKIRYRYDMGKDDNKNYDELVFNIFDNYDDTKIESMSLTVNMPTNINKNNISFYQGNKINSDINYVVNENKLKANFYNYQLNNSITLNMILNDGYFIGQTDNYGFVCLIICLALIILSIYSFISWNKYGKDFNKYYQTVEFYPPDDLDPAQIGYIYGEQSIAKLTIALIISLASKKYIEIEELKNKQYKIKKTNKDNDKKLSLTEQIVYQDLFVKSDEVILSNNYSVTKTISKVKSSLEEIIDKKIKDIESSKKMIFTFILLFIGIILWIGSYLYIRDLNPNYNIIYVLSFIAIFISGFFVIIMNRKTSYGEMITAKILGFRNYLNTAEKSKLEALVLENPNYFYDILPYTYVLNISKKWINNFEKNNLSNIDLKILNNYENDLFMILAK